jgi:hypothetical protein
MNVSSWNDLLEGALVELVVGVNEELLDSIVTWRNMMKGFGGDMTKDLDIMVETAALF